MWIDKRLPALRRHPLYGVLIALGLVALAVLIKLLLPGLPPFLTLFPATLLGAFLGGRWGGLISLAGCTLAAAYFLHAYAPRSDDEAWRTVSLISFVLVGALIVFIVGLLDTSVARLQRERRRLDVALKAAGAGIWEIYPDGTLYWDQNFYHLVGLEVQAKPPSADLFLGMVHPDDRERMANARALMDAGHQPVDLDEYRLIRPDGTTVWLANHRAWVDADGRYFIGFSQDITQRKAAQKQIKSLMAELAHRVKNQYSVILAMVRETNSQSRGKDEMVALITSRIHALSRSHDLLVHGNWQGADLRELLLTHIEAFGMSERVSLVGPELVLLPNAAQYLGLAIHELATNSAKHGAFSTRSGRVDLSWSIDMSRPVQSQFQLAWRETGGPPPTSTQTKGFGSKVLERLTPAALSGSSRLNLAPTGLIWELQAAAASVSGELTSAS
jgi:PAS domain S-box-containing protein